MTGPALAFARDFPSEESYLGRPAGETDIATGARKSCELALQLGPDSENSHDNLGKIHYTSGNLEEALAINPNHAMGYVNRATTRRFR